MHSKIGVDQSAFFVVVEWLSNQEVYFSQINSLIYDHLNTDICTFSHSLFLFLMKNNNVDFVGFDC